LLCALGNASLPSLTKNVREAADKAACSLRLPGSILDDKKTGINDPGLRSVEIYCTGC